MLSTMLVGDILDARVGVLVIPVNCASVMGAGLALQCARRFPAVVPHYRAACEAGRVAPGRVAFFPLGDGRSLCLFPSKRHWRDRSQLADIALALADLRRRLDAHNARHATALSVAVPPIGCGLGGLLWEEVLQHVACHLGRDYPGAVHVFAPRPLRRAG